MNSKVIDTPIGAIEYSSIGKGTPIVFIHGGHSNCMETLSHKGFDLDRYQLITPSRPGYGKTPLNGQFTPAQAAQRIIELIHHLSIDQCVVYGISAGGLTAIELAANHPNKVCKLILASAISMKWLDKNDTTYKTARKIFHPKTEKITWGMVKLFSRVFPALIAKNFYPQFSKRLLHPLDKKDVYELIYTLRYYNSKEGFLNDIDQNIDEEVMSRVKCPTLVIHSENDNSVLVEHAQNAHKKIKGSRIEILQNEWGHLFWIGKDSTQSIARTIEFIEET